MGEHPYQLIDEKGKVICQICGKSYLVISPTHLAKHNLRYEEYTRRYPKAPLSTREFIARGKYGRNKDLFQQPEVSTEELIDETEDPKVEELGLELLVKRTKPLNPMEAMKARILDHLRLHYSNIRKDYLISQFGIDNRLKFEFITDFCDPVLKVIIQFPDTFWHNQEMAIDLNKNIKLMQYGWKVIEIPTASPSFELIEKYLKK